MNPIRIVVADDHPLFRRGVIDAIERTTGLAAVGEASNGDEAWRLIETMKPDVAVLDVEMPGETAIAITRKARASGLPLGIVFLTMHCEEAIFNEAIEAGATGYVLKDAAVTEIPAAIRSAAAGKPYISAAMSSFLLARADRASMLAIKKPELQRLTSTERRVLKYISTGLTSKEVAGQMSVSFRTVENHRANICSKLGLSGTNALLRFALEHKNEL